MFLDAANLVERCSVWSILKTLRGAELESCTGCNSLLHLPLNISIEQALIFPMRSTLDCSFEVETSRTDQLIGTLDVLPSKIHAMHNMGGCSYYSLQKLRYFIDQPKHSTPKTSTYLVFPAYPSV